MWHWFSGHVSFTLPGNFCMRMAAVSTQQLGMGNCCTGRADNTQDNTKQQWWPGSRTGAAREGAGAEAAREATYDTLGGRAWTSGWGYIISVSLNLLVWYIPGCFLPCQCSFPCQADCRSLALFSCRSSQSVWSWHVQKISATSWGDWKIGTTKTCQLQVIYNLYYYIWNSSPPMSLVSAFLNRMVLLSGGVSRGRVCCLVCCWWIFTDSFQYH